MSVETDLKQTIEKVVSHYQLSETEAEQVMGRIMDGEATPAQIAALLTALRLKGETVEEITGFARAMRAKMSRIAPRLKPLVDIVGTGGDRRFTFNISTTAAFVAAGAGSGRQTRQPLGFQPLRQRRRAGGTGCQRDVGAGRGGALPGGDRDRLPVCPGVPRRHEARRRPPAGDRHPHRLQPVGAVDQPGWPRGTGAGSLRPQPDRADCLRAAQARYTPGDGGARQRRAGWDRSTPAGPG